MTSICTLKPSTTWHVNVYTMSHPWVNKLYTSWTFSCNDSLTWVCHTIREVDLHFMNCYYLGHLSLLTVLYSVHTHQGCSWFLKWSKLLLYLLINITIVVKHWIIHIDQAFGRYQGRHIHPLKQTFFHPQIRGYGLLCLLLQYK